VSDKYIMCGFLFATVKNINIPVDCGFLICDRVLHNKFCCDYVLDLTYVLLQFNYVVGHLISCAILLRNLSR
jgi:hypothetical protein